VLINEHADRVNSYNVWNFAEGYDSYYRSMLVDLTQERSQVGEYNCLPETDDVTENNLDSVIG